VYKEAASFVKALNRSNDFNFVQGLVETVSLHHMNSGKSVKDSVKDIIGSNFISYEDQQFVVPRKLDTTGTLGSDVEAWAEGSLSVEGLSELNIEDIPGFSSREELLKEIGDGAEWLNNKQKDGVYLLYTDNRSQKQRFIRDKSGNKVEVKFQDMRKFQRTLDNLN